MLLTSIFSNSIHYSSLMLVGIVLCVWFVMLMYFSLCKIVSLSP